MISRRLTAGTVLVATVIGAALVGQGFRPHTRSPCMRRTIILRMFTLSAPTFRPRSASPMPKYLPEQSRRATAVKHCCGYWQIVRGCWRSGLNSNNAQTVDTLPRIKSVAARAPWTLHMTWADRKKDPIDLTGLIHRSRHFQSSSISRPHSAKYTSRTLAAGLNGRMASTTGPILSR
jgi:hypothetical protein